MSALATNERKHVNVDFAPDAYEVLRDLAGADKTISGVIRDAILLEKMARDYTRAGGRVIFEKDGEARDLLFRQEVDASS